MTIYIYICIHIIITFFFKNPGFLVWFPCLVMWLCGLAHRRHGKSEMKSCAARRQLKRRNGCIGCISNESRLTVQMWALCAMCAVSSASLISDVQTAADRLKLALSHISLIPRDQEDSTRAKLKTVLIHGSMLINLCIAYVCILWKKKWKRISSSYCLSYMHVMNIFCTL